MSSMFRPFSEDREQEGIRMPDENPETMSAGVSICHRKAIKSVRHVHMNGYVHSVTFVQYQQKAWQWRNLASLCHDQFCVVVSDRCLLMIGSSS